MAFHHSRKEFYRLPYGACPVDTEVRLRIDVPATATAVTLRLWYSDGGEVLIPMKMVPVEGEIPPLISYEVTFLTNSTPGWVWYYFIIDEKNVDMYHGASGMVRYYYGNNEKGLGGKGARYNDVPPSYQITVYDKDMPVPSWTKDAVMYHIFVDRFRRGQSSPPLGTGLKKGQVIHPLWDDEPFYGRDEKGNVLQYDFFGGDLQGIMDAIPYLKRLGVNLLYLSPVMDSASNHKYDVGDYKKVDPAFGDERLFRLLTAKAHAHGMKVIIDGVFSHNGADSIYFNRFGHYDSLGAYQSKESPYYNWYIFHDYPNSYDCWWGMTNMPNVKEQSPSYMQYMLWNWDSVVNHWNSMGIDGWRLDVADELPNAFLQAFHGAVKGANKEAFILGEVWEDASKKEAYGEMRPYLQGHELDGVMNYPFRQAVIDTLTGRISTVEGMNMLYSLHEHYPRKIFFSLMNLLSSHDERRILTELGEAPNMDDWTSGDRQNYRLSEAQLDLAKKRLKLALMWQFSFPGIPDIYYGDEAGMEGDKDPFNRRPFPWGKEDKELQKYYTLMGYLRHRYEVLRGGALTPIIDNHMIVFKRSTEEGVDVFGDEAPKQVSYTYLNCNDEYRERSLQLSAGYDWVLYRLKDFTACVDDEFVVHEGHCLHDGKGTKDIQLQFEGYEGMLIVGEAHEVPPQEEPKKGILLHPTALPSQEGIGDLGHEAYEFVDYLVERGQTYWQILPLTEPALANSPYTAYSAVASDRRLISLDSLAVFDLIDRDELEAARAKRNEENPYFAKESFIDVEAVMAFKEPFYEKAFETFKKWQKAESLSKAQEALLNSYKTFVMVNDHWLESYTLFQAIKMVDKTKPWTDWGPMADYKVALEHKEELADKVAYVTFIQWMFYRQWQALHSYANEKGIYIIGDLPFFMAYDSADVWAHKEKFDLDEEGNPNTVAGVPPDYFCEEGQHWGNPQYKWDYMAKNGFDWWISNVEHMLTLVDVLRLDHFRGYDSYWSIPKEAKTAATGHWEQGPGLALFEALERRLSNRVMSNGYEGPLLIAEDLGIITDSVEMLRRKARLLGMHVLQFSFSEDPLPLRDLEERVIYTGTHDNNTLMGWLEDLRQKKDTYTWTQLVNYLGLPADASPKEIGASLIRDAYKMSGAMTIIPLQDLLGFGAESRFNVPGQVNETNWLYRLPSDYKNRNFII